MLAGVFCQRAGAPLVHGSKKAVHEGRAFLSIAATRLPRGIPAVGWPQWVFCADEFMQCQCPGPVRWGDGNHWLKLSHRAGPVTCSAAELRNPNPGLTGQMHCECAVGRGSDAWYRLSPAVLPEADTSTPVVSCEIMHDESRESPRAWALWQAVRGMCMPSFARRTAAKASRAPPEAGPYALGDGELQALLYAWVDPRFRRNYEWAFDSDGWVDKAFVNYVGNCAEGGKYDRMMQQLIRSVHLFSARPLIVVHFGMLPPPAWDAKRFPRLVLLHARPLPESQRWRSFNYNKYRAMLLAKVRTGILLDSDEFVAPGVDAMFDRTAEEVTKDYPLPIMPVHFLPDKGPSSGGVWWPRFCKPDGTCPLQTMRWGHAHPTWTYFALPFLGKWLQRNLRDEVLPERPGFPDSALRVLDVPEDEDLLNAGLWEDGATKQWCKFETPDPSDFETLLEGRLDGGVVADKRFYPDGAPLVFYTAHHTVDPEYSEQLITELHKRSQAGTLPAPIAYKGAFYHNASELRKDHPDVPCLI